MGWNKELVVRNNILPRAFDLSEAVSGLIPLFYIKVSLVYVRQIAFIPMHVIVHSGRFYTQQNAVHPKVRQKKAYDLGQVVSHLLVLVFSSVNLAS